MRVERAPVLALERARPDPVVAATSRRRARAGARASAARFARGRGRPRARRGRRRRATSRSCRRAGRSRAGCRRRTGAGSSRRARGASRRSRARRSGSIGFVVRRLGAVAPARRAAAGAAQRGERLLGGDEAVALAAGVEVALRLEVEARERAAGLLARLLGRGQVEARARTRERDVEEAPLLLERAAGALGLVERPAREARRGRRARTASGRARGSGPRRGRRRRRRPTRAPSPGGRSAARPRPSGSGRRGQPVLVGRARPLRKASGNAASVALELVRCVGERSDGRELLDVLAWRVERAAALLELAEVVEPLPERVDRGCRPSAAA